MRNFFLLLVCLSSCSFHEVSIYDSVAMAIEEERWEDALELLNYSVTSVDSTDPEAYHQLGVVYENLNDNRNALKSYTRSISLKWNSITFYNRGRLNFELNNMMQALSDYDNSILLDSSYASSYYYRGIAKNKLEIDPISDYTKAIVLDSGYVNAYFSRARAHANKRDRKLARADYMKVIYLDSNDSEGWYELGYTHFDLMDTLEGCLCLIESQNLGYSKLEDGLPSFCR